MYHLQRKFRVSVYATAAATFAALSYLTYTHSPEIRYQSQKAVSLSSMMKSQRSPASLSNGRSLDVIIDKGQIAYLDESANIGTLIINGELHCDQQRAPNLVELRVKEIQINGVFQCGTSTQPYTKKMIISLKDSALDPKVDEGYRGIVVEPGGRLVLNGNTSNAGWYPLNKTVLPGEQTITVDLGLIRSQNLEASPTGRKIALRALPWKVGDQIVIGPTGYAYTEAEQFTITAINPNFPYQITLDHPIQHQHWGETQTYQNTILGDFTLDERAEVANLTRSILIRGDEADAPIDEGTGPLAQRGGHIMVHHSGKAYLNGVELYKMGQAGVMGRYPFHWHWAGDVSGQYVKNSSIHHTFQRCITIHRTQNALLQNNVCYDFKGHGYFLEDGNETGNKILGNLAIMAKPPSSTKLLLASDDVAHSEGQGRFPAVSGFWISNPQNIVKYNVASGSVGTGIWMSFENEVKDLNGNIVARPIKEPTCEFDYNTAHAAKVGITWDGGATGALTNNPNNPNDRAVVSAHYEPPNVPTFTGLIAYKNYLTGIYFRGNTAVYKRNIVADNGWSYWMAYNQIVKDSIFIGKTNNVSAAMNLDYYTKNYSNARKRKTGIVLYDGPFEVHHSDFLDFSTQAETYALPNSYPFNSTVTPFTLTGGTNKFVNVTSGLRFMPDPYFRAHIEGPSENSLGRSGLGNASIRDLDGSLSGTGKRSVVTATRSLGVTAASGCVEGGTSLYNFKICPGDFHEGSFNFMRWNASAWWTGYLVRRSDGALNFLQPEWNMLPNVPHNVFATISNQDYTYEMLPYYQYKTDKNVGAWPAIDANHELAHVNAPVVKIVAYGTNCRLDSGHYVVSHSLEELKQQTTSSYYSSGKDFYVRLIPDHHWDPITGGSVSQATAYTTMIPNRFGLVCDDAFLPTEVIGKITRVEYGATQTIISGWACNYTHAASIMVKLYAVGPDRINMPTQRLLPTYIAEQASNKPSDPKTTFDCGKLSTAGRNFSISVPNSSLASFTNHKFYVKGISNNGGADLYIENSGKYPVKKPVINPVEESRQ